MEANLLRHADSWRQKEHKKAQEECSSEGRSDPSQCHTSPRDYEQQWLCQVDSAPQMSENPVPEEAANGLGDNEVSARASTRVFKMLTFIEGWTRSDRSAAEGRGGGCGKENSNSALVRAPRYDPGPVI